MDQKTMNQTLKHLKSAFTKKAIKEKKRYYADWFNLNMRDVEEVEGFFSEFDWRDKERSSIHFRIKEEARNKYSELQESGEFYILNNHELEVEFRLHALIFFGMHEKESDPAILTATAKPFALAPEEEMFEIIKDLPETKGFWTDERIRKLKTHYEETRKNPTSISATGVSIRGDRYTIVEW
jgi:hypothetical protein